MLDEKLVRCRNCGQKISADARFCPLCGAKVSSFGSQQKKKNTDRSAAEPWESGSRSSMREKAYSSMGFSGDADESSEVSASYDNEKGVLQDEALAGGAFNGCAPDTGNNKRNKGKSKALIIILVLIAVVIAAAAVVFAFYVHFSDNFEDTVDELLGNTSEAEEYYGDDYDFENDMYSFSAFELDMQAKISEQVVYDYGDVTVTLKEVDFSSPASYYDMELVIENNSDQTIMLCQDYISVNDYTMFGFMSGTVTAGSVAVQTVSIYTDELIESGITDIEEIGFNLYTANPNTYETLYTAEPVSVRTSVYGKVTQKNTAEGELLYNDENVEVRLKSIENDVFGDCVFTFCVENKTEEKTMLTSGDISANGYMIDDSLYIYMLPGTKTIGSLYIYSDDMEVIETVYPVSMSMQVYEFDSGENLVDTGRIEIDKK